MTKKNETRKANQPNPEIIYLKQAISFFFHLYANENNENIASSVFSC